MTEPDDADDSDDLVARVRASTERVTPGPSALERVRGALERRRRRRRAQVAVASVAAAATLSLAGVAGVVVVPALLDTSPDEPVDPAEQVDQAPAPAIIQGGGYRPAGFFRDIVGGVAMPSIVRYYRTDPRVVFTARFDWSPEPAGPTYLGGLTLERYRSDPEQRCDRLVGGAAQCVTLDDETVLARYEVPADGALLAPVSGEGRLRLPGSSGVLRGVTYFRADARAVTVLVCSCGTPDGDVVSRTPPVAFEALADVVTDDSWGLRVGD